MRQAMVLVALLVYPIASVTQVKFYVLACVVLVLVDCIEHVHRGTVPSTTVRLGWPVYAFIALALASALWSISRRDTLAGSRMLLAAFALFHASLVLFRRRGRSWMLRVVLVVPVVYLCVVAWVMARFGSFRAISFDMHEVVGSLSNQAPAVIELALPYLLYITVVDRSRRPLALASAACGLFIVFASESRGALLILAAMVVLMMFLFGRTGRGRVHVIIALFVVGAALGGLFVGGFGREYAVAPVERIASSQMLSVAGGEEAERGESDYKRILMVTEGINAIRTHWVRGIGYNALAAYTERTYPSGIISHNIILTAWGELGLCGLVLTMVIVVVGTRRVWIARSRARRDDARAFYFHTATLIAWVGSLLHAQLRPQLTNPMFYVVVAAAFAAGTTRGHGSYQCTSS